MIKIFLSYTLRDKSLSVEDLSAFKRAIELLPKMQIYVDILDNKNANDPQGEVFYHLDKASIVWIVNSEHIEASPWAAKEIAIAKESGVPVHYLDLSIIRTIAKSDSIFEIEQNVEKYLH